METEILQNRGDVMPESQRFPKQLQTPAPGEGARSAGEVETRWGSALGGSWNRSSTSRQSSACSPSVCLDGTGSGEPADTETEVIVEPGSIRKEIPEGVFLIDTYNEVTVPQSPFLREGKCWMLPRSRAKERATTEPATQRK